MHYEVDGNWGPWGPFGRCNTACTKMKKRICNDPSPSSNGGAKCLGGNGKEQVWSAKCNDKFCGKLLHSVYVAMTVCLLNYVTYVDEYMTYIYIYLHIVCLFVLRNFCLQYSMCKRYIPEGS